MKKRKISILALLLTAIICFAVGIGCAKETEGRIVIQTDSTEIVVALGDRYTTPIAGVFDSNLDRINGRQVIVRVYNGKGALIEESEPSEQVHFAFISTGTWKIEYTAYKGDVVDANVDKATIIAYVCNRLKTPDNFTVSGNTLTWDEVANASSYEVTVNGGEPVQISGTSFTNDIFNDTGFYVGVTAKGDNRKYVDSNMATYLNRTPLADGVLMAFDDPCYELDVKSAVSQKITLDPDQIKWVSEEECEGSTGGALKVRIRSGNYGWGVFKVMTMSGVKLDTNKEWSGMEIRFKIDSESYRDDTWFFLNPPTKHNNAQRSGVHVKMEKNNQWMVLRLDKSVVLKEGYTKFTTLPSSTVTMEDNVVKWDKNESAYGYQVEVTRTDLTGESVIKTYPSYSIDNGFVVGDETSYSFNLTDATDLYVDSSEYTYSVRVLCEVPTSHDSLNFNLYDLIRTTGVGFVYLDYVRLYTDELSAPNNFRYENGKILWDTLEDVDSYTLNIVKVGEYGDEHSQYYVDETLANLILHLLD